LSDTGGKDDKDDEEETNQGFWVRFGETSHVEELGKDEGVDAGDVVRSPDKDGVSKKSEKEGKDKKSVVAEFLISVDKTEEDAGIFDEGGAEEVGAEDVKEKEASVDNDPNNEPAPVDGANTL